MRAGRGAFSQPRFKPIYAMRDFHEAAPLPVSRLTRLLWLFGAIALAVGLFQILGALEPTRRPQSQALRAFQEKVLAALDGATQARVSVPSDITSSYPTMCLVGPYETIREKYLYILSQYTTPIRQS